MLVEKGLQCSFALGLLTLRILAAQADTTGVSEYAKPHYQALATVTIGPDFVQNGQAQTLSLLLPFQNHYTNTNNQKTAPTRQQAINKSRGNMTRF